MIIKYELKSIAIVKHKSIAMGNEFHNKSIRQKIHVS